MNITELDALVRFLYTQGFTDARQDGFAVRCQCPETGVGGFVHNWEEAYGLVAKKREIFNQTWKEKQQ